MKREHSDGRSSGQSNRPWVQGILLVGLFLIAAAVPVQGQLPDAQGAPPPGVPPVMAGSDLSPIRNRVLTVPRGGGLWVKLPLMQACEFELSSSSPFHFFITPVNGPAAYQAWFKGGQATMPVMSRSNDGRRHTVRLSQPLDQTYYLLVDHGNYPRGQVVPHSPLTVTMSLAAR